MRASSGMGLPRRIHREPAVLASVLAGASGTVLAELWRGARRTLRWTGPPRSAVPAVCLDDPRFRCMGDGAVTTS